MWYVGLDWADTHHDVEVLDEGGKRVGMRRFAHSHKGLHELKAFLLTIAASPEKLACIVETNRGLLITFLLEAGIPVYPVNPKLAEPRPTASMRICWPNWADWTWQNCAAWSRIVPLWLS